MQLLTQALGLLTRGRDPEADAHLASMARRRIAIAALPLGLALVARGVVALDRLIAEKVAQLGELEQRISQAAAAADVPPRVDVEDQAEAGVRAHANGCAYKDGHPGECAFAVPTKVSFDDDLPAIPLCDDPSCEVGSLHDHGRGSGAVDPRAGVEAFYAVPR